MSAKWTTRPVAWNEKGNMTRVPRSSTGAFTTRPGVYAVYGDGRLMYIGMAERMATRVSQHFISNWMQEECAHFLQRDVREWTVKYRPERFPCERATLEMRLIARLRPPINRLGTGKQARVRKNLEYREADALWRGDSVAWWTQSFGRNRPHSTVTHRYWSQGQTFCGLPVPGKERRTEISTNRDRCQRCEAMFMRAEVYREEHEREGERSA